ncbi:MAG: hypothetical protein JO197_08830 [Acidobacteria bacterium]|nr:hypothetical protein [Acidobacteriota bacterium]MBV9478090.1 hypothetical protein [Acidobacteriota bacterium]
MNDALRDAARVIVTADIALGPGEVFSVAIDDMAASLPEEECFRFALHYYARVLYELAQSQRSMHRLPEWTARVAQTAVDRDTDCFAIAGTGGTLVQSIERPLARVHVAMRTSGLRDREVTGDLAPLRGSSLARSVLAVCQAVLPRLSDSVRAALPSALANMNASYELAHHYADPDSQRHVPSVAYLAASFV